MVPTRLRPGSDRGQTLGARTGLTDEARRGWLESTSSVVEPSEAILEVNVQPLAASLTCLLPGHLDEVCPDPHSPRTGGHHRVLNPRVYRAVPDHVHEANESTAFPSNDPPRLCCATRDCQSHSSAVNSPVSNASALRAFTSSFSMAPRHRYSIDIRAVFQATVSAPVPAIWGTPVCQSYCVSLG